MMGVNEFNKCSDIRFIFFSSYHINFINPIMVSNYRTKHMPAVMYAVEENNFNYFIRNE